MYQFVRFLVELHLYFSLISYSTQVCCILVHQLKTIGVRMYWIPLRAFCDTILSVMQVFEMLSVST